MEPINQLELTKWPMIKSRRVTSPLSGEDVFVERQLFGREVIWAGCSGTSMSDH